MSGTGVIGQSVLILTTDRSQLRSGFAAARTEALRETQQISTDAKIQLRAKLDQLRADFNAAERAARDASVSINRQATFTARMDLAKFQSDLRVAEREQAASIKRMQQQARQSQQGSGLASFGADVLGGIGLGSGAAAVQTGLSLLNRTFEAGRAAIFDYSAGVEQSEARIRGYTRSQEEVAKAQALANRQVELGRGTYAESLSALADLTPLARTYKVNLDDLLKTTQLLAATDPAQGFEGAAVAIREALSGDFTSLVRRFEIPRSEIQRLKDEGVPNLQIVQRTLAQLGITDSLLTEQAKTRTQQLKIAGDQATRILAQVGAPISGATGDLLGSLVRYLNSDEVKRAIEGFGRAVREDVDRLRAALSNPEIQQGLRSIAGGFREAAVANLEFLRTLTQLAGGTILAAIGAIGQLAKGLQLAKDRLIDLDKSLTGTDKISKVLIATLTGSPQTIFTGIVNDLKEIARLVEDPKLEAVLNRYLSGAPAYDPNAAGRNTGPGSFPQAGPAPTPYNPATGTSGGPGPQTGAGTYVPPPTPQDVPENYGQDYANAAAQAILKQRNKALSEGQVALYRQGQADIQRYLNAFQPADFDIFGKLKPQIESSFDRAFGDLDPATQFEKGKGNLDVITARIVDDIRSIGHVSGETERIVRETFGNQAEAVLGAANAYAVYRDKQEQVTRATAELQGAQEQLTAAQREAQQHQEELRDSTQGLKDDLAALNKEAAAKARGYEARVDTLRESLAAFQRQAEEAQREFQRQIAAAQAEQQAAQDAATRNAAAYAAVLNGTTAQYREQNQQLSEQELKILALGDAALSAALKAKTAQDDTVQSLEVQQRAQVLALEERIRAARQPGGAGEKEARRLEAERDRVKAQSEYQLQLERQRAAVRGDQVDQAKKPIEAAAAAQATEDKKRVDEAGKRVTEIQAQAQAQAESDRVAAQALEDRLTAIQKEAKTAADDYAARGRAIQDNIDKEEDRGRVIAAIDKKAIDDAQTRVDNAKTVKDNADLELIAQGKIVDALGTQNTILDTRFKAWKAFYEDVLKPAGQIMADFANGAPPIPPSTGPSAVGGGRDGRTTTPDVNGAPAPGETPPPPGIGPGPMPSTYPSSNLRIGDLPFARTNCTPAVARPPSLPVTVFAAGGAPSFARAGGQTINNFNAPLTSFPNATIRETVEVEKAIRGGADLALRLLHGAQIEDETGGGTLVRGR